ncbi:hypothetical protein [Alteromonas gracilis]
MMTILEVMHDYQLRAVDNDLAHYEFSMPNVGKALMIVINCREDLLSDLE